MPRDCDVYLEDVIEAAVRVKGDVYPVDGHHGSARFTLAKFALNHRIATTCSTVMISPNVKSLAECHTVQPALVFSTQRRKRSSSMEPHCLFDFAYLDGSVWIPSVTSSANDQLMPYLPYNKEKSR